VTLAQLLLLEKLCNEDNMAMPSQNKLGTSNDH